MFKADDEKWNLPFLHFLKGIDNTMIHSLQIKRQLLVYVSQKIAFLYFNDPWRT